MPHFEKSTEIAATADDLYDYHAARGAFSRLTPPWEHADLVEDIPSLTNGVRARIQVGAGPARLEWLAEHRDCEPGRGFTDVQLKGPFASWAHRHEFTALGEDRSRLTDRIKFRLPFGPLGLIAGEGFVQDKLTRMFRYRHTVTRQDLERASTLPAEEPLSIVITGATGLIGDELVPYLRMRGHTVRRVTRHPRSPGDIGWDPATGSIDFPRDEKVDAIIHLAGENIAGGRWTEERKRRILESRRDGTRLVAKLATSLSTPPRVLVSMSGANYYATGPGEPRSENDPSGDDFLAGVCRVWEQETRPVAEAGIRVAILRLGVVLSPAGGALAKLLPLFRAGLGGPVGSGWQRMSWIAMDDVVDLLHRATIDPRYEGPINIAAPELPTNTAFARTLGAVLRRPSFAPAPAFALETVFGEMADATILADVAMAPRRLQELAYPFRFPTLAGALAHLTGSKPVEPE